jgi:hypothetical protein
MTILYCYLADGRVNAASQPRKSYRRQAQYVHDSGQDHTGVADHRYCLLQMAL